MRRFMIAAPVLLICLSMSSQPAEALDTFGATPDKKLARAFVGAADACFECGEKARALGLNTFARSYFGHALAYDPEHRDTRRVMGFKKRKKDWVLEKDLVPARDEIEESKRADLESKLTDQTAPIRQKAADELWKLVEDKTLPREQRLLALFHLLRLRPEHGPARRAARTSDGPYGPVHDLDGDAETFRKQWIQAATEGEAVTETTPYETAIGIKLEKRRGAWIMFHAHLGDKGAEWARTLTQFAEAARARSTQVLGVDPGKAPEKDADRLHYSIFATRESYRSFVEKCSNFPDATRRSDAATKAFGTEVYSPYGAAYLQTDLTNDYGTRDAIAHDIAVKGVVRCVGWEGYCFLRGLGYLNSVHMNGSIASTFWAVKTSGAGDDAREALPGLGRSAAAWRFRVAVETACGGALEFEKLAALRAPDYTEREMAYSFCLMEYLVAMHKEALTKFMESARTELQTRRKDKRDLEIGPELLERLFSALGQDSAKFASGFADWVGSNYVRIPDGQ